MKKKYGKEFYLKRFQEAVCFLTVYYIASRFGTVAEYEKASPEKKASCLGFRADLASRLSRMSGGRSEFLNFINESQGLFKYHRRVNLNHWTGRKYIRNQWFELSPETLAKWFSDERNFEIDTCWLICEKTKQWLKKYAFEEQLTVYEFK